MSNRVWVLAVATFMGLLGSAHAADLSYEGYRETYLPQRRVVVEREFVRDPVAMVQRVDVVAVTPHHRYVVYEDAPAYLYAVHAPHPPVVVRVPRYFPRTVLYNRPSHLPPLKRCLC